ncbi:MAG: TerC family protein [Bacteroidia bacterium]
MLEHLLSPDALVSLLTLTLMEIILGIDNIVFISIVAGKLPEEDQPRARTVGLAIAMLFRIGLLLGIKWLMGLTKPLFTLPLIDIDISAKSLILLAGGLFLIGKSVTEMHSKLEGFEEPDRPSKVKSFMSVIVQIIIIDMVFSFDSILTAVGLADHVETMIAAVVISMIIMIIFAGKISDFINKRPTVKMLALSFLILIGFMLVLEAIGQHIDKGYIYFAMAFSLVVEMLNQRLRKDTPAVELREPMKESLEND